MRRFFVLVFVIALILGLTACAGTSPEAEPTAAPAATEAPAATAEPAATQAPDQKDSRTAANVVFTIDPARSTARYLIPRATRECDLAQ